MEESKIIPKPIVDLSSLNDDQREAFDRLKDFIYDKNDDKD